MWEGWYKLLQTCQSLVKSKLELASTSLRLLTEKKSRKVCCGGMPDIEIPSGKCHQCTCTWNSGHCISIFLYITTNQWSHYLSGRYFVFCKIVLFFFLLEKAWKRMVTKVCYVGEGFTRKPPKYERFIRPMVRSSFLNNASMHWLLHNACMHSLTGCKIVPNAGANATKFFTLAIKSWKFVAKLATRMLHLILT